MRRILVGMSGGVDSAMTARILKQDPQNYIEGCTMYLGKHSEQAVKRAKEVCQVLNIKHHIIDVSYVFNENIIKDFEKGYLDGITPLPCAKCNKEIKFGAVLDYMKAFDFNYFATGHYVKKIIENNEIKILRPSDSSKDQTHFLAGVKKEALKHMLFPLGDMIKKEVKEMATDLNIGLDTQAESQDICFLENKPYINFLENRIENEKLYEKGPIVHLKTGKILGEHNGTIRFTIGQRRNIGVAFSEPLYVIKIDKEKKTVYVGTESDLYSKNFQIKNLNLISNKYENMDEFTLEISTRAMKATKKGDIKVFLENGIKCAQISLHEPDRAITVGQMAVFYEGNRLLGGGIISSVN